MAIATQRTVTVSVPSTQQTQAKRQPRQRTGPLASRAKTSISLQRLLVDRALRVPSCRDYCGEPQIQTRARATPSCIVLGDDAVALPYYEGGSVWGEGEALGAVEAR